MRAPLLLLTLCLGCVVPYTKGATTTAVMPAAPPADFSQVDARLDALFTSTDDVDRRDRVTAAMDFSRKSRLLPAESQAVNLAFLQQLVTIEERTLPYAAPVLIGDGAHKSEGSQEVEGEDPVEDAPPTVDPLAAPLPDRVDPAAVSTPADALSKAKAALQRGDPEAALAALAPCPAEPCASQETWTSARDAYVYKAREEAGARYLASRDIADPAARVAALQGVRSSLQDLSKRFPDSKYADAIQKNLALVERDLANLTPTP